MICKAVKCGIVSGIALVAAGGIFFGTDAFSYLTSSAVRVREVVKKNVPIEFELKRAQDLLEEIIPEMHANIRLIAEEEVELAQLQTELAESESRLAMQRGVIKRLRENLTIHSASLSDARRERLTRDLSHRFDLLKEAEMVRASKTNLLKTRERALAVAQNALEKTQTRKIMLQDQIKLLESKWRMVKASAAEGKGHLMDDSKLVKTENLINRIHQRLKVAERVLAHEARFIPELEVESLNPVSEAALLEEIDLYLSPELDALKSDKTLKRHASKNQALPPLEAPDEQAALKLDA